MPTTPPARSGRLCATEPRCVFGRRCPNRGATPVGSSRRRGTGRQGRTGPIPPSAAPYAPPSRAEPVTGRAVAAACGGRRSGGRRLSAGGLRPGGDGRGERLRDFMAPAMTRPEAASSRVRFRPIRSVGGQISREITGMRGGVFSFSGKYGKIWSWPKRSIYGKNEIINYHIYVEVRFDGRDRRRKLLYGNHTRR